MSDTTDVAVPDDTDYGSTGLEDIEASDLVMPRLSIKHSEGVFTDNLSGVDYPFIDAIVLGLVKQRILWAPEVDDGDGPLCKSYDFKSGHPDEREFPWAEAGFDVGATDEKGRLPCDGCQLKEWDSHPKNKTPWCSEQHTFPLIHLIGTDGEEALEQPSTLTIQRSAIKNSKAYLTNFARSKTPLFTVVTRISLQQFTRGNVTYAVPSFQRLAEVDRDRYPDLAATFRNIREFLHQPPVREDEDEDSTTAAAPPAKPTAPPAQPKSSKKATKPAPAPAPTATQAVEVEDDEDDDLPF